jgi:flagellin
VPIFINTNRDALIAQRGLRRNGPSLSKAIERLSSGLRINSGADDSAGLSIATRLGARVRSLNQAIQNVNAGISVVQTAEGALTESSTLLERLREIAVQAANDTNTDSDRVSLQSEVDQIIDELNRVGNATEFNTNKLLDGSFKDKDIQIGVDANQAVSITISDSRAAKLGARAVAVGTAVGGTILDSGQVFFNGKDVGPSSSEDDTVSTTLLSSSALAKAAAINRAGGLTGVVATIEDTVVTSKKAVTAFTLTAGGLLINSIDVGIVNNILDNDSGGILTAAINAVTSTTGVSATLDSASGLITLTAGDGRNVDFDANSNKVDFITGQVASAPLTITSNDPFTITGSASSILGLSTGLFTVGLIDVVAAISVSTKSGANSALATIDAAIDQVSLRRGDLGAVQNRLINAVEGLQTASENLALAKGRIEDADFAVETARLSRGIIIESIGVALLAQANSRPEIVLELLS